MEWPGLPEREPAPAGLSDRERVGLAGYGRLSDRKPGSMEGTCVPARRNAPWAVGTASRRYRLACLCRFGCPPPPGAASPAFSNRKRPGTRLAGPQQATSPARPRRRDAENLHGLTICPSHPPQGCARPSRVAPCRASAPPVTPRCPAPGSPTVLPGYGVRWCGHPQPAPSNGAATLDGAGAFPGSRRARSRSKHDFVGYRGETGSSRGRPSRHRARQVRSIPKRQTCTGIRNPNEQG